MNTLGNILRSTLHKNLYHLPSLIQQLLMVYTEKLITRYRDTVPSLSHPQVVCSDGGRDILFSLYSFNRSRRGDVLKHNF